MRREIFPSGFSVDAALRAFVLKLAAAEVDLAALPRPGGVFDHDRDTGHGFSDKPGDESGWRQSAQAGERAKPGGVIKRTSRGKRVCLGIVLVHAQSVTRVSRTSFA